MKAIETRYAGCHFRSRIEARWAVFFDAMEWSWGYEPEGFELPSGRYLPDFKVEMHPRPGEVWVEIKGAPASDLEKQLMRELIQASPGVGFDAPHRGIILQGDIPRIDEHLTCLRFDWMGDSAWQYLKWDRPLQLQAALEAARSARFEHGESGRT